MNKLSTYITLEAVRLDLNLSSLKRLFEGAGLALESAYGIPHDEAFTALNERERLGSTALGFGCAVPHARLAGLEEPAVVLLRTLEPLKVPSPDKTGAQLFIVILAPEDGADDHLELLRETAELFSDAEARETLLKASTPVEVCEFLTHWETAQTAAAQ